MGTVLHWWPFGHNPDAGSDCICQARQGMVGEVGEGPRKVKNWMGKGEEEKVERQWEVVDLTSNF